jgi:hypothetical protein
VLSQNLTLRAGQTTVVTGANGEPALVPTGSHCWVEETDAFGASKVILSNGDYDSGAVVPSTSGVAHLSLTVTNIFNDPDLFPLTDDGDDGQGGGSGLGNTGSPLPAASLWAAAGAVVLGLMMVVAALRRRRRP